MGGVADGNMQFIRGDDAKCRIPKFPPELVPYDRYFHSTRGFWSILDGVNHAGCNGEQQRNDQDWNHSPCKLDLRAPVHLSWFASKVSCFTAEPHDHVSQ